jgi:23S rRNA (uracil1939-C5)-methyltransferase
LNKDFIEKHGKADVIVTDPPRSGMHEDVVKTLLEHQSKAIVYVSCNAATQARDIAMLSEKYEVEKMRAVDMFPQTTHIENVAKLVLRR